MSHESKKKLGLAVNVNANALMHHFFNGDLSTAHISKEGEKYFDYSFAQNTPIGCPFSVHHRYAEIQERMETFASVYKKNGIDIDFIFVDWEVDGTSEWNGAWEASKKCARCCKNISDIQNFEVFQKSMREIRSDMQKKVYTDVFKSYFPDIVIGNYGVYPCDGNRYWYDYYEKNVEAAPHIQDQKAIYRKWFHEYPLTGYNLAMPVCYTWYPTFSWYHFKNPDYRWFYNLLLNGNNALKSAGEKDIVMGFVHWHTTVPPANPDPEVKQFSQEKYQELLWHFLLRGMDGLALWCMEKESEKEVELVHQVYSDSLQYLSFLEKGKPITFEVPQKEGPVVSGLFDGDKVLIRRTDFDDTREEVILQYQSKKIKIPRKEGTCQLLQV